MFDPIFFSRVDVVTDELENEVLAIDPKRLSPNFFYRIAGIGQVQNFTLVYWITGNFQEYYAGETLWRGHTPILMTGGQLNFNTSFEYQEKGQRTSLLEYIDLAPLRSGMSESLYKLLRESMVFFDL